MLLKSLYAKCPNCKYIVRYTWVASCNTFDATFYSDWLVVWNWMHNKDTELVKCPKCKSPIRTDESNIRINGWDWDYEELILSDYVNLLDTDHIKDPNKEYHIRLKILRWYNDRIRHWYDKDYKRLMLPKDKETRDTNLERLIILQENKINIIHESLLFLSELYRESWRFDDCIRVLDDIKDKRADNIIKQLRKACEEKNPYVIKLKI